ncbi:MAG: transcription termination factor Rho [Eggerthellaceae bacterium]|nr:transcription termination factor Rho [Eggerthellaceae bacterium]
MIESENNAIAEGAEPAEKKPVRRRTKKVDAAAAEAAPAPEAPAASEAGSAEAPKPRRTRTRKAAAVEEAPAAVEAAPAPEAPATGEAPKPRRTRARKAAPESAPEASAAAEAAEQAPSPAPEGAQVAEEPKRRPRSRVKKDAAGDKPEAAAEAKPEAAAEAPAPEVEAKPEGAPAPEAAAEGAESKADAGEQREKPYGKNRRDRNRDKREDASGKAQQGQGSQKHNGGDNRQNNNGKQNGQKQNNRDRDDRRRNRRERNQNNREVVPSVTREGLAELKVADLRAKAAELALDASGMKKAELVEAVYEASMKAEGFIEVSGVLDIMPDGYGFLRASGYLPGEGDAYVGTALVRRNGLRKGDFVVGQTRPARENEKFAAIQKIISVNDVPIAELGARPRFADLTPVYPDERLLMEHGRTTITARVIDLCAPIGKGQRGLIVSPPKAGKTTVLKDIAASITANNPEVHLMCLLVDERPEEVTDMERSIKGEVVSSTFDMPSENHIAVAELVIERAKRLVEMGRDVVILLDSITRLARAYNLAQPASGRILSGGVDSTALYPPKRFLGAARNIEGGGSLTILASALIDTGSKMDEVIFEEFKGTGNMELKLDRYLADRRIFPAIDPVTSGTRKEDLLLNPQEAPLIWAVRRILANLNNTERAMDMLIKSLKQTETNQEFLIRTAKKAQTQAGKTDENFEF